MEILDQPIKAENWSAITKCGICEARLRIYEKDVFWWMLSNYRVNCPICKSNIDLTGEGYPPWSVKEAIRNRPKEIIEPNY